MRTSTITPRLMLAALAAAAASAALPAQAVTVLPPADLGGWTCTGVCGTSPADGDITTSPLGNARYGYVATSGSTALGTSPLALDANSRGEGTETNGSKIVSGAFDATAGDRLDIRFNFVSTDGKGFDDYAWARVIDAIDGRSVAWLFTARSSNSGSGKIVPGDVLTKKQFDPDEAIVGFKDFEFHSKDADDPIDWAPLGASNRTCWKENAAGCGHTGWLQTRFSFADSGSFRLEFGVVNWGDGAFDSGLAFDFANLTPASPVPVPEPASALLMALGLLAVGGRRQRGRRAPRVR